MIASFTRKIHTYYPLITKAKDKLIEYQKNKLSEFDRKRKNFYKELWQDAAQRLNANIDDLGDENFQIEREGILTFVRRSSVMIDSHLILEIAGNKPLIHKILSRYDYPIGRFFEYNLSTLKDAWQFVEKLGNPAVVKPAKAGHAGRGVTTGINSYKRLQKASWKAAGISRQLLLEEQVKGDSYRVVYLNGEFLDAVRRHPPHIVGDGRRSIRELIQAETKRRLKGENISFFPISIDLEMDFFLASTGYELSSVLSNNTKIPVKRVVNQNSCEDNESVKEVIHPDIVEMGARISRLLNIQLAGMDLITPDITRPLPEVGGVINEINTTPGLHHHYLISDKKKITPLAYYILKFLLSPQVKFFFMTNGNEHTNKRTEKIEEV